MIDIIDLLGSLQAEEAVPLLIKIMENRGSHSGKEKMGVEMKALCQIGSRAVPKLIEEIEQAHVRAANLSLIVFGFCMESIGPTTEGFDYEGIEENEEEQYSEIEMGTHRILLRTTKVLGEIRDQRALTRLETLLDKTKDPFLIPYVQEAIEKIRMNIG